MNLKEVSSNVRRRATGNARGVEYVYRFVDFSSLAAKYDRMNNQSLNEEIEMSLPQRI